MDIIYMHLKDYRKYLLRHKHTSIKRGDHRFKSEQYCSACGRPLAIYDPTINEYVVIKDLFNIRKGGDSYTLCMKPRDCLNYKSKKDHTDIVRLGVR